VRGDAVAFGGLGAHPGARRLTLSAERGAGTSLRRSPHIRLDLVVGRYMRTAQPVGGRGGEAAP
jgi:hypothetical protein